MLQKSLRQYRIINDKLSRIFKIDFHYLMRGGSLLSLTQITSAGFGFLLTIAFARFLPQEIYGVYRYILATYALLVITSLPGLDTSLIQTFAKGNHRAFIESIKTKFWYGFIGTGLSILYGIYHLYTGDAQLFWLFTMVGLILPFIECLSLYTGVLNAQKRYGFWAITEVANQFFSTLSLFLTIYFTNNIYLLILAYFVPYIIVRGISTLYALRNFIENNNYDPSYLSYGKAMTWYQIITRGIASLDQMVLFHYMGPAQVAIFSIANAIPTRFQSVLRITGTLAFPKYANYPEEEIAKSLPKKMLIFGFGILIVCISYTVIAPPFFAIFFPKYNESIQYSQLLIFFVVSGMTYPFGAFLNAHKKVTENYLFAILSFSVKVACLTILVPIYGIWGAAWGVVLSSWSTIGATYFLIWKIRNK
jgi:O-antigen/teichoic acid export membrane protein